MHQQAEEAIHDSLKISDFDKATKGTAPKSRNIFQGILSSNLPIDEKKRGQIAQEGITVITAGGETTARVLTTATFHLLANPKSVLVRLKNELAITMEYPNARPDVRTLEKTSLTGKPCKFAMRDESYRINTDRSD